MREGGLGELAAGFAGLSLVAVGGANAVMPDIQRQVVEGMRLMSAAEFAHLFAISQAAPGPNVMIVSLVGWQAAGLAGLLVATLAMCGPSCLLAFGVSRFVNRHGSAGWLKAAKAGLAPVAVGLFVASGLVMARAADTGIGLLAVTAGATALVGLTGRNPLWALAAGGLVGALTV